MADAGSTVRGTIDLNVRPARRALRELRADAQRTNRDFERLSKSIDRVGASRRQMQQLRTEVRGIGQDTRKSESVVRRAMEQKTKSVRAQRNEVRLLRQQLRGLGKERIAPTVDVRGIHRAIAAVELLIRRLNALSRQRATPHVGIGGGLLGGGAALARGPPGRNAFGGRGGLLRSLDLGPFQVNPRALGALTAVALPAVQQLVGAVGALTASLGAAAAGFGALGTAAAGASAIGLGSIAAIAAPVTKQLGEVWKAQEALTAQQQSATQAGDLQRANLERVRGAHETLASTQRTSLYVQERLTQARKDARRELISLSMAADRSVLSEARARLAVRQSIERLREVEMDPRATDLDRQEARLSVREARFGVREARVERRFTRQDYRTARRQGVGGMPQVVDARRGVADARRQLVNARRGLREAGAEMARGADAIATAKENLDRAFSRAPRGTRSLLRDIRELRALWGAGTETTSGRATDPRVRQAQSEFVGVLRGGVGALTDLTPTLGRAGLRSTRALAREQVGFNQFLTGGRTKQFIGTGAAMFDENLRAWRLTSQNVAETLMNITRAARPFLRDASAFMQDWTGGWADSTRDIEGTRRRIREMVDHFKSWKNLVGATWDLLKTLGSGATRPGQSLVDSLTGQMRLWDRWAERNPSRVRQFFENAARSTARMASALREVVQSLSQMAELLRPLLDNFTTLLTGAGALGLLQPGALAIGYGAYRGLRGRGAAAGGAPPVGIAPPLRGGPRVPVDPRSLMYGGNWRSGAPVSQLGSRSIGGLTRSSAGALGRMGMGALRFGGPSLVLSGLLGALGQQGSWDQKIQGGLSNLTLGAIPRPTVLSEDERVARSSDAAQEFIGGLPGGLGVRRAGQASAQLRAINSELAKRRALLKPESELSPEARAYNETLRAQRGILRDLVQQQRRLHAARQASDIQRAFGIRSRDVGPEQAMERAVAQTLRTQRRLGPEGAKIVAQSNLQWARQQARSNPALINEVERLERGIKRRFSRLGKHVQIVNGQILTGSAREWSNIADAITTRAARASQQASEEFTRLQRKAVGSLRAMGFSEGDARRLVAAIEEGGNVGRRARWSARNPNAPAATSDIVTSRGQGGHARGGRIRGRDRHSRQDIVALPNGERAAHDELMIANRHTEQRVNRMLWQGGFTTTLGSLVEGEQRAHSQQMRRFATGGRYRGVTGDTDFVPALGNALSSMSRRTGRSIYVQSGRRTLAEQSALYAAYLAGTGNLAAAPNANAPHVRGIAADITPGREVFGGVAGRFGLGFTVPSESWHIELLNAAAAAAGARGMAGGPLGRKVSLRARRSRLGGVPGALSTRAGQMYAAGLQRKINDKLGAGGGGLGGGLGGFAGGGSAAANMRLGRQMMLRLWGEDQWNALRELWMRESGWRHTAENPSSGAFGIPQCVDLDTEILTREGWKRHDEVRAGDETIAYNPDTGKSEWTLIEEVLHPGEAELWEFGVSRFTARCTPNHRWLMERMVNDRPVAEEMVELQAHEGRKHRVVLAREAETGGGLPITLEEAALLGWIAGDGWHEAGRVSRRATPYRGCKMHYRAETYYVSQSKQENWPAIDAAVGVRGRVTRTRRGHREWRLSPAHARSLKERAGDPKSDAMAIVLAMSAEQRCAWLDAIKRSEGYRDPGGRYEQISQCEDEVAEAIKLAVYLDGKRPSVYRNDRTAEPGRRSVELTIGVTDPRIGMRLAQARHVGIAAVWCVRTALGSWTARQDGKVFLTGNSLPASKMASAGADWRTNPATQIRWGLNYIKGRYGSPSAALAFWQANNWYGRGGRFQARRPQLFGVGDRQATGGREDVSIRKVGPGGTLRSNTAGGGIQVVMNFGDVKVTGQHDLEALFGRAADVAAARLSKALERAGVVNDGVLAG